MSTEEDARKAYIEAGVDLEELSPEQKEETPAQATEETKEESKEEAKENLQPEPKEPTKRSIYDEYKEKKAEARTEREARELAERERDEWRQKFEALNTAETKEEQKQATDDLEAFAQRTNTDPAALRELRDILLKDVKPQSDPDLANRLAEFEKWREANASIVEQQMFDNEYAQSLPKLKRIFPNASDDEMQGVRDKLNELSHTKEWHDKSLAYIAFEKQEELSQLISPKKRGMESKERTAVDEGDTTFDPNADLSQMSSKQLEVWEKQYRSMVDAEKRVANSGGRKVML